MATIKIDLDKKIMEIIKNEVESQKENKVSKQFAGVIFQTITTELENQKVNLNESEFIFSVKHLINKKELIVKETTVSDDQLIVFAVELPK